MKKILFAVLFLVLLVGQCWGADYYVNSNTGSDTYDGTSATYVSGTTGPKAGIITGAALMDGGDTLHVANGSYAPTANLLWPNGGSNTISGESKVGVIIDLTAITGNWIQLSGSDDDNGKVENVTIKNLQASTKYALQISDADNFTIKKSNFKDNQRIWNVVSGSTGFLADKVNVSGIRDSARSSTINTSGSWEIRNSIFRGSENFTSSSLLVYNATSSGVINNSCFSGSLLSGINFVEAATCVISNSNFVGNGISSENGTYHITGSCANVSLVNCYTPKNILYTMDDEILTGFTEEDPRLIGYGKTGYVSIGIDDLVNWEYAFDIAEILNPVGVKITFYCNSSGLPTTPGVEDDVMLWDDVKTFLDAGNDIACHSKNHPNDITIDADNLPTSGLWDTEITGAKAEIEAYVRQISGYGSWDCVVWGSPAGGGSSNLSDRIKTDGFIYGRMSGVNDGDKYRLDSFAAFTAKALGQEYWVDSGVVSQDLINQTCAFLRTAGGFGEIYFHNIASGDPAVEDYLNLVTYLNDNSIVIITPRNLIAYLEANATSSGTAGNEFRYQLLLSDRFNGKLRLDSPCVDSATNVSAMWGETDIDGNPQYGQRDIGPTERQPKTPQFFGKIIRR